MMTRLTSDGILDQAARIVDQARLTRPLVTHHTNIVVANDSANVTLAVGGSPLISLAEEEQTDLAKISSAVLLNIGTIHQKQRAAIIEAARAASTYNKPIILDPVGVGATAYRQQVTQEILDSFKPTVIKGNAGEIGYLAGSDKILARGLDSITADEQSAPLLAFTLAKARNAVVILHGPVDYISDGQTVVELSNGHDRLAEITGTGCSLGSVVATYVGAVTEKRKGDNTPEEVLAASVAAVLAVTVAGELAAESPSVRGSSSYKTAWIDELSQISGEGIKARAKIRLVEINQ